MTSSLLGALAICLSISALAQSNRIDIIRHDAPELAHFGEFDIGVRTLELTDPDRPDVLSTAEGSETVFYDRSLTVEVWYPAKLADNQQPGATYTTTTRNPAVTATLHGRAVRDAAAQPMAEPMPLIIISHGYPGNRYLMSHLGENLASKGYVVASIDHRDSTYTDQQVDPGLTAHDIAPAAPEHQVKTLAAVKLVCRTAAIQQVIATATAQRVIAAATKQQVGLLVAL